MEPTHLRAYDMHCHPYFAGNAVELLCALNAAGIGLFANTVTPAEYLQVRSEQPRSLLARTEPAVALGLGLHPWWLADGTCGESDVALFEELALQTPYIGEVGLDFAPRRTGTFDLQISALKRIAQSCSEAHKTISLHAMRSADTVLDILDESGCLDSCTCIFHWFSGSSDELVRAVRHGCWFSLGARTLGTKRGRAYARAIPPGRLLIETDWPDDPTDSLDPATWVGKWDWELQAANDLLAQALDADPADLAEQLAQNSRVALGLR